MLRSPTQSSKIGPNYAAVNKRPSKKKRRKRTTSSAPPTSVPAPPPTAPPPPPASAAPTDPHPLRHRPASPANLPKKKPNGTISDSEPERKKIGILQPPLNGGGNPPHLYDRKNSPNSPKQPKITTVTTSAQTIGTFPQFASQKNSLFNEYPYLCAVWTQSGESGNTLKNKCSGTADERANIFPCLQRAKAESSSQCSVSGIMPYSY